jgi:5-methylcytosine-specific restriction protein A
VPVFPCHWPTCGAYVAKRGMYCPDHADKGREARRETRKRRNPEAIKFYSSAAWQRARAIRLREHPVCESCGQAWSVDVHHCNIPLDECTLEQALDQKNLRALCVPCHMRIEKTKAT